MQSNGPRAASSQKFKFVVYPETKVVPQNIWHPLRQQLSKLCLLLIALAISGITTGVAQGAPTGTLTFSPSSASLGSVAIGMSRTIAVTITNTANTPVVISGESLIGSGFSVSGLLTPYTLAAATSIVVSVKFSPTSSGFYSGYISLTTRKSSVSYSISGTGVSPGQLSATPSSANFSSVAVGSKNTQTIQLKNTGGTSLTISGETLSGAGFSVSGLASPLSLTLAPSQTASFTVGFAPTTSGSVTGSVTLKSTATNSTLTLPLSGTGASATPTLSLGTSSLNFGNEVVGGSISLPVTAKNTGNSSLTVSQIGVVGTGFSVASGVAGTTIAAGQTAELSVVFAPKTTGSVSGGVTITSNASNSPSSISMAGTGVSSTAHSVTLNWVASSSSGVIGYYVYRSTTSGGSYTRLTTVAVNPLTYADGSVSASQTYYYVVTAVNSSGAQSVYSEQVSATIP
jgi:hypothetical protein